MASSRLTSDQERLRIANILPAFALALCDKIGEAMQSEGARSPMATASLVQIHSEPGLSIERLRTMIGLSHSGTVRILDQLEHDGLVTRQRQAKGDARISVLELTEAGKAETERLLAARRRVALTLIESLSASELVALDSIIAKTIDRIVRPGVDQHIVCRLCDPDACPQALCPVNICIRA